MASSSCATPKPALPQPKEPSNGRHRNLRGADRPHDVVPLLRERRRALSARGVRARHGHARRRDGRWLHPPARRRNQRCHNQRSRRMVAIETLEGLIDRTMWFHYNVSGDVLYLRVASERDTATLGEETDDGFILLRDAETSAATTKGAVEWSPSKP